MRAQGLPIKVRAAAVLAVALVLLPLLGACTQGGQFDPTELFNNDMFDAKKKLKGQREAVFPNGVPGTASGVPADLVKGYQPPPDPSDVDASQQPPQGAAPGAAPKTAAAAEPSEKPKPKPKPRPKVATAPTQPAAQSNDPIWNQTQPGPAAKGPTRINVGAKPAAPAQDQSGASQPASQPASPPASAPWPSPTPAQQVQTNWPAPPARSQ
jgi:hypothetical protein